jgi:hypothetical protein
MCYEDDVTSSCVTTARSKARRPVLLWNRHAMYGRLLLPGENLNHAWAVRVGLGGCMPLLLDASTACPSNMPVRPHRFVFDGGFRRCPICKETFFFALCHILSKSDH